MELEEAIGRKDHKAIEEVVMIGAFSTMGYCGGLRGEEIVLGDLGGMNDHWEEAISGKTPHVPMALLGRFKGETGEQYHYIPLAPVTASGIKVHFWMSTLRRWYKAKGIFKGPIFRNAKGKRVREGYWAQVILSRFQAIQLSRRDIIPEDVKVTEEYGMSRSWRRGSNAQALAQGVSEDMINRNNRWRTKERSKGNLSNDRTLRGRQTDCEETDGLFGSAVIGRRIGVAEVGEISEVTRGDLRQRDKTNKTT